MEDDLKEVMETYIDFKFHCLKKEQKYLVEFILRFSNLDLKELAEVIDEDVMILNQVIIGQTYLSEKSIINLVQLFYMFAQFCEFEH